MKPFTVLFGAIGFTTAGSTSPPQSRNAGLGDLFQANSFGYSAGPSLSWDVFNYGRITNGIRVQDARFQQLAVDYEDTVLKAVQEVEDALVAFTRTQDQVAFLADAVEAYKSSTNLSMRQYKEGLVDFQRVIDSQRSQAQAQDLLTSTEGSVAENLVAVYKALGGGWQIRLGKDFVPAETQEEMRKRTNWGGLLSAEELKTPPGDQRMKWQRPDW